jgi:lysophospholipase L1-like esterase
MRTITLVAFLTICLALLTGCSSTVQAAVTTPDPTQQTTALVGHAIAPPIHVNILTYADLYAAGDSLTAGANASGPSMQYPVRLQSLLETNGHGSAIPTIHGYGGYTTGMILIKLKADYLSSAGFPLIVVEAGANDFQYNHLQGVPLATFQQNYHDLLSYLINPDGRVVPARPVVACLSIWQSPTLKNSLGVTGAEYNQVIANECGNLGSYGISAHYTVDITTLFLNPACHSTSGDTFHPDDAGYGAMAQAIYSAIPRFTIGHQYRFAFDHCR